MRCSRCGNENPVDNRFCGMCGATLLAAPAAAPVKVPETATQRAASAGLDLPAAPVVTAARPPELPRPVETPRP
ncbi:MAG: zinc-ribbon domain-containing protein, partial [Candidatus Sulfotelmatobacter sp.]